ncbi:MAG: 16S rRNA (cytosine(1402)-N(4))-methyltransferase RsmH [bacterium]|nr:16S rRNA (cytosine(1402)-N(4))-methyltransferase RsmH [bacterium]
MPSPEPVTNPNIATGSGHIPVLLHEVIRLTAPQPGEHVVDCTLGAGGYAEAFLQATAPAGQLLGIDLDAALAPRVRERLAPFGERFRLVHGSFAALASIAKGFPMPSIIVADLGLSSVALDNPERGFSFQQDGSLDMRMDQSKGETVVDLIRESSVAQLEHILKIYGEEPHSHTIAHAIVAAAKRQPITRTIQLVEVIDAAYRAILHAPAGRKLWLGRGLHPATRTFQALRIAVNKELASLEVMLPQAFELLGAGGRLAIVSFHSLEDRMVKQFMKQLCARCVCPRPTASQLEAGVAPEQLQCTCSRIPRATSITHKAVQASPEEISINPRSRSAKLRVIRKT